MPAAAKASVMQTTKNKVILIILFAFLNCTDATAQKVKFNSKGKAISQFINNPVVIKNFKNWNHKQDSLIVLVDLKGLMGSDTLSQWQGIKLTMLQEGSLVDSLKLLDAHYLLKNRCNYYVLMSREENRKTTIATLRHPCTNVVSTVKITEKNRRFYLGKIENAVW